MYDNDRFRFQTAEKAKSVSSSPRYNNKITILPEILLKFNEDGEVQTLAKLNEGALIASPYRAHNPNPLIQQSSSAEQESIVNSLVFKQKTHY